MSTNPDGFRSAQSLRAALIAIAFVASLGVGVGGPARQASAASMASNADRYRTVDCLLPGEIRKLGSMVYQSARRPIKTSVEECEGRGGEYAVFSAGSAGAALSYWLPLAKEGDKAAQTTVGEMFEKGIGQTPDFAAAAVWYRRAADQGYARAQINLGNLYEKGLGVPRDPVTALNLYRKAANLDASIVLDDGSGSTSRSEEVRRLRQELDETRGELEKARRQLELQRNGAEAEIERLKRQQSAAANVGNTTEARRLDGQVKELESQLLQHRRQVAMLQQSEKRYQDQILALESETGQLRQQVATAATRDQELDRLRRELADTRRDFDRAKRELDAERSLAQAEITRLHQQQADAVSKGRSAEARRLDEQTRQTQAQLVQRERQLAALESSAERYREQIRALEGETSQLRQQVVALEGQIGGLNEKLGAAGRDLAERQRLAGEDEQRIAVLRDELARQKQVAQASASERARIAEIQKQLKGREDEQLRQAREIERLGRQVKQYQDQIARLETERREVLAKAEPPRIELIDPKVAVQQVRGQLQVKVRGDLVSREIIGRVNAPAGLLSFKINELPELPTADGVFKVAVPLRRTSTPVHIVAIDRQLRESVVDLLLVAEEQTPQARFSTGQASPESLVRNLLNPADMGRYHALVIGNNNYAKLERLDTPVNDARAVAKVLREKFGFQVTVLENATRVDTMRAFAEMRKKLTNRDNLLIYYAGHGVLDPEKRRGFWQPVDAEPDNDALWINNVDITDTILAMEAKHVLLIADSCYSGTLTRSSLTRFESGKTEEQRVTYLRSIAKAKVRVVMTSGGDAPVLDGGGDGKHSVFARNLLDVLNNVGDALEASKIADAVRERVVAQAANLHHIQRPIYQPLSFAGHEGGDFVFLPRN